MTPEQEKVFPYEALESLGINKKDLKASDTDALLDGRKTGLMKFSVKDTPERKKVLEREKVDFSADNGKLDFEGKIQLQKYMTVENTEDNKNILKNAKIDFEESQNNKLKLDSSAIRKLAIGVLVLVSPVTALALVLIPRRTEIKNDSGLSDKDIKDLKLGEVIGRINAKNEHVLTQLDKDTNNLVSVRSKDISIPNKVAGQEITPIQKEQLKNGQEIQVKDNTGQTVFAKIDLNEKTGLSLKDENGQKITVTPEQKPDTKKDIGISSEINLDNKQTPEIKLSNDKDRLQHIANNGLDGIKDIHPADTKLRDEFLEKYNLKKDFYAGKEAVKGYDLSDSMAQTMVYKQKLNTLSSKMKETASIEIGKLENKQEQGLKSELKISADSTDGEKLFYVDTVQTDKNSFEYTQNLKDKEKERAILADIAKNGLDGVDRQHYTNNKALNHVLERHNLNPTLNSLGEQISLARGGSDPEIYKANQEIPKLETKLKSEAGLALDRIDNKQTLQNDHVIKNEMKQETISFKMKM